MKKHFSAAISLLLIICVLFLTGCNVKEEKSNTTTETTTQETETLEDLAETLDETTEEDITEEVSLDDTTLAPAVSPKPSKKPAKVPAPIVTVPATIPAPVKKDVDSYKWNPAGVYEVGSGKNKLVPGEYYVLKTGSQMSSINIINNKTGTKFARAVEHSYLVTLSADEEIYLVGCKIINASVERPHAESGKYLQGIYKVGRDIPAGEYIFRTVSLNGLRGNPGVTYLSSTAITRPGEIYSLVKAFGYLTLKEGQYIKLYGCTLENKTDKPIYDKGSKDYYPQGMYLVGKDLPAGEYIARPSTDSPSLAIFNSSALYADPVKSFTFPRDPKNNAHQEIVVSLKAGQYVVADNATLTKRPSLG